MGAEILGDHIVKPSIRKHPHANQPYTDMGWCSLREIHLMAKQHAARLSPDLKFPITDNIGEFMRRYWLFCQLSLQCNDHEIPFCHSNGDITVISLQEACHGIDKRGDENESGMPIHNEHEIFISMVQENSDLLIPALFAGRIKTAVCYGGDAIHTGANLIVHTREFGHCIGPLFVRMAVMTKQAGFPIYSVYTQDWEKSLNA